jgi:hypothetical protein
MADTLLETEQENKMNLIGLILGEAGSGKKTLI